MTMTTGEEPWLTVIGIGDDGTDGLAPSVRALIDGAELLVGGERHQAMVADSAAVRLTWEGGVHHAAESIRAWRGRRVVVLATGDPMWFGGGANLSRWFSPAEMRVIPHPGAFSLAAARMLWPLADVVCLSAHGKPLGEVVRSLMPGLRLLVLSRDGETPAAAARLLTEHAYGSSEITVLEHLGGAAERRVDGIAATWDHPPCADLNTLAIVCRADAGCRALPWTAGLADDVYETDGQLTKRETRAITVAALTPLPGQVLWDIGAGSGSIAIEWLRAATPIRIAGGSEARAFAIERNAERCRMIQANAARLGTPQLAVVHGSAPEMLADLPPPDRIFVGGGVTLAGMLEVCWDALNQGGRLVANAVSLEAVARLLDFQADHGGTLTRLAVSRAEPVGGLTAFRPLMEVIQLTATKTASEP
ncbi:MAG: precorrin-6y C5,15-methyltransferase (decarboxylating) subunit CbiE [Rhodospirillales bacterium]|nr:precorrin-6y C5,15-methyltransferase (decarboxylating) subunit CbiE [Rhodospirillales bacterium]